MSTPTVPKKSCYSFMWCMIVCFHRQNKFNVFLMLYNVCSSNFSCKNVFKNMSIYIKAFHWKLYVILFVQKKRQQRSSKIISCSKNGEKGVFWNHFNLFWTSINCLYQKRKLNARIWRDLKIIKYIRKIIICKNKEYCYVQLNLTKSFSRKSSKSSSFSIAFVEFTIVFLFCGCKIYLKCFYSGKRRRKSSILFQYRLCLGLVMKSMMNYDCLPVLQFNSGLYFCSANSEFEIN